MSDIETVITTTSSESIRCTYLSSKFIHIFDQYASEKLKKERTKGQYWYVVCSICNEAKCDFLDITPKQVTEYFSYLMPNTTLKSTNYNLSVLRALSRYLDENADRYQLEPKFLSLFSEIKVEFPDMEFRVEDLPSLKNIDTILSYYKRNGDMVGFLACSLVLRTALTTNEMVLLDRKMFFQDANGNYGVRIPISNYAYRFIKIPDDVAALITQYTSQRIDDNPSLFLNKKGKKISARALQNRLHEACLACEIPPFTYNDLRTLSQAILIKDGAPLDKVAEHTNIKKLDWFFRYNRVVKELEDSAVDYAHIKVLW